MICIVHEAKTIAKFERFEGNKAMDWITQKGLFVETKFNMDGNTIWVVKNLP